MRIIVIGAVAAGTSAAAKARRNNDDAEIVIYEQGSDISYSGCGLPYYIGDEVKDIAQLTPRDEAFFKKKYAIDVKTRHQVIDIDPVQKSVLVKNLLTGKQWSDRYDKLVIATGASAFLPEIAGIEKGHVFALRNVQDALKTKRFINEVTPGKAVIVGSGFIGFEMLENLLNHQIEVTMVEMMNKITPNLDDDMARFLETALRAHGVQIIKGKRLQVIEAKTVVLSDGTRLAADMVIMATGVRPNVRLAQSAGVALGESGAIKVAPDMSTNLGDVYACGDCIETFSQLTGKPVYRPLGSTANKTGRIAGDALTGGSLHYQGNLGTAIFKVFDLSVATTGLSEREAVAEGYDVIVSHTIKPDKPTYFDGEEMAIKGIADRTTGQLLGAQIVGRAGVDKRIDVFATLITYKAKVAELFHIDLAYAPPFATTKDPVHYTGMILNNAIDRGRELITAQTLKEEASDLQIIDARSEGDYQNKGHVANALNLPHAKLRETMQQLDPNKKTVTYCNKGVTGNAAQNILLHHGFKKVYNLSGGHKFYAATRHLADNALQDDRQTRKK